MNYTYRWLIKQAVLHVAPGRQYVSFALLALIFTAPQLSFGGVCDGVHVPLKSKIKRDASFLDNGQAALFMKRLQGAKAGDRCDQYKVGLRYWYGIGVAEDNHLAAYWLQKSADEGVIEAEYYIGWMYLYGLGVPQNEVLGIHWLTSSALNGDATAQGNLGFAYQYGVGVKINRDQYLNWYKKAADQDDPIGLYGMGVAYMNGHHVEKNYEKGMRMMERSARLGLLDAQYHLASFYNYFKDPINAYAWAKAAESCGYGHQATMFAEEISSNMPNEDLILADEKYKKILREIRSNECFRLPFPTKATKAK